MPIGNDTQMSPFVGQNVEMMLLLLLHEMPSVHFL